MGTVAVMSLREVARRRGVLVLLVLLPLSFYLIAATLVSALRLRVIRWPQPRTSP